VTLRTLKVPVGLQLVSGVRYGDSARSIILSAAYGRDYRHPAALAFVPYGIVLVRVRVRYITGVRVLGACVEFNLN